MATLAVRCAGCSSDTRPVRLLAPIGRHRPVKAVPLRPRLPAPGSACRKPTRRRSAHVAAALNAPGWWPAVDGALRDRCADLAYDLAAAGAALRKSDVAQAMGLLEPALRGATLSRKQEAVLSAAFDGLWPCLAALAVGLFLLRWLLRDLPEIRGQELRGSSRPALAGAAPSPPATALTLILMVIVAYGFYLQCGTTRTPVGLVLGAPDLRPWPANEWALTSGGLWAGEYWRLLSPVLLHANVLHLAANLRAWWSLRFVEAWFGPLGYVLILGASAIGGAAASFAFHTGNFASVGASGAICGLLGADMVVSRPAACLQSLLGLSLLTAASCFLPALGVCVDNWAHWGGLITGYCVASVLGLLKVLLHRPEPQQV
eukprot:jgi/Tetstr1/441196/TSEL_029452.t1